MSLYPVLWAAEHAPIYDAEERAILTALVMKGDFDGCNCYRSRPALAKAARVDPKTVDRKLAAMEKRGLIRRQPGPKPASWLRLPRDKRPNVWEVLIPCEFWSAVQLEEINAARTERGRPAITPENRPAIAEAPPKKVRADKGRPRTRTERGDFKSSRGGTSSPVAGGLQVQSRGDFKSTNLPSSPSDSPSSSSSGTPASTQSSRTHHGSKEEGSATPDTSGDRAEAEALVVEATSRWVGHRLPTRPERLRLTERVAEVLSGGASPDGVVQALTRDLEPGRVRTTAVQVVMSRTSVPGWADLVPAPRVSLERPVYGPRCGDPRHDPYAPPYDRHLYENGQIIGRCECARPLAGAGAVSA